MKRFKYFLRSLFVLFLTLSQSPACANEIDSICARGTDSVRISLLTCGPGNEVYSYYGHTAIRVRGKSFYFYNRRGDFDEIRDVVINYGCFSFQQKFFILRFVFGLTDYQVGISTYDRFIAEYTLDKRWVKEQVLQLTEKEANDIYDAIQINLQKENRTYRYNYFYDNCTTRARDILIKHINGTVNYNFNVGEEKTYRDMVHSFCTHHRWSAFGNDLLLGVGADRPISATEQQFLPISLYDDFERATITAADGSKKPLVIERNDLIIAEQPHYNDTEKTSIPSPSVLLGGLSLLLFILTCYEIKKRKLLWPIDAIVMGGTGLLGIVLLAMIFSQHPTVSCNFQILLLNPLHLVFLYPTIKQIRQNKLHFWYRIWAVMLCLFMAIGLLGIQHYAEGMLLLACPLLIRQCWILYIFSKHTKTKGKNE